MSRRKSNPANSALKNKDGNVIFKMDNFLSRWEEYIKELYDDEDRDNELNVENSEAALEGCEIFASEIQSAIQQMKIIRPLGMIIFRKKCHKLVEKYIAFAFLSENLSHIH